MKQLLLMLLIPTLSYSQITYDDVMSINSEKTFKRIMIEKGYEFDRDEDGRWITYGLDIQKSIFGDKSSSWSNYDTQNDEFNFTFYFSGNDYLDRDNPYNIIVKKIKKNCKYYDIVNFVGIDFVCYSCPESTYKGKIGFVVSEGKGLINHFIF